MCGLSNRYHFNIHAVFKTVNVTVMTCQIESQFPGLLGFIIGLVL